MNRNANLLCSQACSCVVRQQQVGVVFLSNRQGFHLTAMQREYPAERYQAGRLMTRRQDFPKVDAWTGQCPWAVISHFVPDRLGNEDLMKIAQ